MMMLVFGEMDGGYLSASTRFDYPKYHGLMKAAYYKNIYGHIYKLNYSFIFTSLFRF